MPPVWNFVLRSTAQERSPKGLSMLSLNEGKTRVMIVEDESIIAADLKNRVRALGYAADVSVATGEQALQAAVSYKPDVILMDIVLRGAMTGIEVTGRLRDMCDVPVIYVTSHGDSPTLQKACRTNPYGYVLKPFDERELQAAIEVALYRHQVERKLRKMERWMATTLDSIGDAVIATDIERRVILMNPVAEQLTGWTQSEARGRHFDQVFRVFDAASGEPLKNLAEKALREGFSMGVNEHVFLRAKGGGSIPIDDNISPIRNDAGQVIGIVLVFRDCRERIRRTEVELQRLEESLEDRVKQQTSDLEAANRELAAFAYSVSHDLRAPLHTVNGFSFLLAQQYADVLDEEGKQFLNTIRTNCDHMNEMIDSFLRLFRLQHKTLIITPIDMNALVGELTRDLLATAANRRLRIAIQPLPEAMGDRSLIQQVWVNLLNNAVKFSQHRDDPCIEIGGHGDDALVHYHVKDNGAGFDPAYGSRLFGLFQRLHGQEFEGTGIGLTIVARIVQRHGGGVEASGVVDQGATLSFSLPRLQSVGDCLNGDSGPYEASVATCCDAVDFDHGG
jgi:PAS domain S-box-containing protein